MVLTALIEAVLFGIYWATMPPVFLACFAGTVLAGMIWIGLIGLLQRVKTVERLLLLMVPVGLLSMFAGLVVVVTKPEPLWPYVCGVVFGAMLMLCGFARRFLLF